MATSAHRLGFAVKLLASGGLPSHDTRRWRSGPHLCHSLAALRRIIDRLDGDDIRMYRMATTLAPYASHPELPQFHDQVAECEEELAAVGALARERDVRLSTHPGQYTVLNSERPETRAAAVAELEVQAALLDAMGLGPEAVVVLHVGGAAGGTAAALDRFEAGLKRKRSHQALPQGRGLVVVALHRHAAAGHHVQASDTRLDDVVHPCCAVLSASDRLRTRTTPYERRASSPWRHRLLQPPRLGLRRVRPHPVRRPRERARHLYRPALAWAHPHDGRDPSLERHRGPQTG